MRATETYMLKFLQIMPCLAVPIYQRPYCWGPRQWSQLWDDILAAGANDNVTTYFLGAIVYVQKWAYQVTGWALPLVIDGQQRLTTIIILLEALARHLGDFEIFPGFTTAMVRDSYIRTPGQTALKHSIKLRLGDADRATLQAICSQQPLPPGHSPAIANAFAFFEQRVKALGPDLPLLCKGLVKLLILDMALDPTQDHPQKIFESMNATGRGLTQTDLIRNYLVMDQDQDGRERLYDECWRPMERYLEPDAAGEPVGAFTRHFLARETAAVVKPVALYEQFKRYTKATGAEAVAAELKRRAPHYAAIALGREQDPALARPFADLRRLRSSAAHPLLLHLYDRYTNGVFGPHEFERMLRLIESYILRRAVCGIHAGAHREFFAAFARAIRENRFLESVQAHFLVQPAHRRFPADEEFARHLRQPHFYGLKVCRYVLDRLETHGRREPVPLGECTIEHIMPQDPDLHEQWQADLGPDWRQTHAALLHSIGNLTLSAYNGEFGTLPFAEKRDMPKGGFGKSPLHLNAGLASLEVFDRDAILARTEELAASALAVWPMPLVPEDTLRVRYAPRAAGFTVDDHRHLRHGAPMHELYVELSRVILAFEPGITEHFLRHYSAFKADGLGNFCVVEPYRNRLRLSLNLQFGELLDPRGLAIDITGLDRRGSGGVEISIDRRESLPYVIGLIRQAYDRQRRNPDLAIRP